MLGWRTALHTVDNLGYEQCRLGRRTFEFFEWDCDEEGTDGWVEARPVGLMLMTVDGEVSDCATEEIWVYVITQIEK